MIDLEAKARETKREERIAEFALGALLFAVQGMAGRGLPDDESARAAVRLGRVVYSEIDQPTEPLPVPEAAGPTERELDWRETLYQEPNPIEEL